MATTVNITRWRGDTVPDKVIVTDTDGNAIDITGYSFEFTLSSKKDPPDETTKLYALTGVITDAVNGAVEFRPTAGDADQTPDKYYYDIQVIDVAGYKQTLLIGTYTYKQDVTKT